jgi:hypothetical protein
MTADRDRVLQEPLRRNPFWVCLLVFGLLGVDGGLRFNRLLAQRHQLTQAELSQAVTIGQMSGALADLPGVEARLQKLSMELLQVATTNAAAAQIVREFNVQWTPGKANAAGTNAAPNP